MSESMNSGLPMISDVNVYGLDESVKASKYPYAIDTNACTSAVTDTVKNLANCQTGAGHDQFLTGIVVQFDLTFSVKAWTEAQRYHFLDFVSSQSTMHRITKFDLDRRYVDYVDRRVIDVMHELVNNYNNEPSQENYLKVLYTNPCGFMLTARMTTNYRQLKTIYQQRRNHILPEWRVFCDWIATLPLAHELIIRDNAY